MMSSQAGSAVIQTGDAKPAYQALGGGVAAQVVSSVPSTGSGWLTSDELAAVQVARANFDLINSKLQHVKQTLRDAQEEANITIPRLDQFAAKRAAAIFLGESVAEVTAEANAFQKKREISALATVAIPGLELRVKDLSEALEIAQGGLRSCVVKGLKAALQRQVNVYCVQAKTTEFKLAELLTLDDMVAHFTGTRLVDQAGELRSVSKLPAPPPELLVPGTRTINSNFRQFLLEGTSVEFEKLKESIRMEIRVDLKQNASLLLIENMAR
jgi:hypothetical protein